MPRGAFLLVRKGSEIGAIRFTRIDLGKESGTGTATYDAYFQSDGSGMLVKANAVNRLGNITVKPLVGVGHYSFARGERKLRIGRWSFDCDYPGRVNMWPHGKSEGDYGFEFAPTAATEVADIDANDKRLRWFRFDRNSQVVLKLADLPK